MGWITFQPLSITTICSFLLPGFKEHDVVHGSLSWVAHGTHTREQFFEKSSPEMAVIIMLDITKKTPWSESASELYRPSDRRLSAK
jgi:hypothetical protein